MPARSLSASLLVAVAASADRSLFTPVAAPTTLTGQPVYGAPALQLGDAFAQPLVQQVEYAPAPQTTDSQLWLWAGAGALAAVGAAALRPKASSAVADLDEADLESGLQSARVAMLFTSGGGGGKKKGFFENFNLTGFLMSGRTGSDKTKVALYGKRNAELELLSGATRPASDSKELLDNRFKILYDTRGLNSRSAGTGRAAPQKASGPMKTWRSKNPTVQLYGTGAGGGKTGFRFTRREKGAKK